MPKGANKSLLETFGYRQRTKKNRNQLHVTDYIDVQVNEHEISAREKELHVTVDSRSVNSVGLKLEIKNNRIYISNAKNVIAYYDENTLKEAFEKKYKKLILVLASSKKEGGKEWFWFNEAYLLEGFSFERFAELVKDGVVKLDLRIGHYPDGRSHDHGTGFRVLPKDRPKCFEKIVRII
jgi:hypothetical protein